MKEYFRPLVQVGGARPAEALTLAGGWGWFTQCERITRDTCGAIVDAGAVPGHWIERLTTPRGALAGVDLGSPRILGILNVTPDSFSDGGMHTEPDVAAMRALDMVAAGAELIDVGGESTRPGAAFVPEAEEIARIEPVIRMIRDKGVDAIISIDTRKAVVAEAARAAGADLINDVSGFTFDEGLAGVALQNEMPVCIMHAQGTPEVMQDAPDYDNVLLDVFDWLEERIQSLEAMGMPRARMIADPGIGFGKTFAHNVTLLQRISLFHALGVGLLLGVSRKGFIGRIGKEPEPTARGPGSVAVALAALGQGVQIIRAHDVADHRQAIALWRACVA